MAAERCSDCGINWPIGTKQCGQCLSDLDHFLYATSITAAEAKSLRALAEFERYYDRHDQTRVGPTPEELGLEDSKAEVERIRFLRQTLAEIHALPETPHPLGLE